MDTVLHTTNLPSGPAWIGLYRDCRESWRWSGGEVVTFTHWRSQLPCAVLNAAGFWEERNCSEENYFICESQGYKVMYPANQDDCGTDVHSVLNQVSQRAQSEIESCLTIDRNEQETGNGGVQSTVGSVVSQLYTPSLLIFVFTGGGQQYRLIRENKTFAAAQRHCRESCSDLPRVDSVGENLISICILFTATNSSEQYHFIRYKLSWVRAQEYCRHNHRDLVTVFTEEQQNKLLSLTNTDDKGAAWIGLYNSTQRVPGSGGAAGSPYTQTQGRVCVLMDSEGGWEERDCQERNYFMCLNKTERSNVTLIELNQTWTGAQSVCRQKHTELVSVRSQSENEEVRRSARRHRVWIGLYNEPWKWSDQGASSFRNWAGGQPGSAGGQRCAQVDLQGSPRGRWTETNCSEITPFFCHWDNRNLVLVREEKSWAEALDHCQTHHTGLADIQSHQEQSYAVEEARSAESAWVWLGLRQSRIFGFWFWVNGQPLNYQKWGTGGGNQSTSNSYCGALDRDRGGSWTNRDCEEKLSFICYRGTETPLPPLSDSQSES
ncbi:MRC2 protein, partial [Atractosteus spatula]|nr:MRC2 protein [Atractosteus spatula]